jgi:hypothetical protein
MHRHYKDTYTGQLEYLFNWNKDQAYFTRKNVSILMCGLDSNEEDEEVLDDEEEQDDEEVMDEEGEEQDYLGRKQGALVNTRTEINITHRNDFMCFLL